MQSQKRHSPEGFIRMGYPPIASLPESQDRPLWSVMIPTYNCAEYLRETLTSVLTQDPGPDQMQVEVVDDCSTEDHPESVVRELGNGRVLFFRQPKNVGPTENFNTCLRRARGHVVHILHGDDLVLQGFYRRLERALCADSSIGAAFCRCICTDDDGHWQSIAALERKTSGILTGWAEKMAVENRMPFPSVVVKRRAYEELGGFHPELYHAADWDMWKRIAVHYSISYEPLPLACNRVHSSSDTSRLMRSGANIADVRRAIEIACLYLPKPIQRELTREALRNNARRALGAARHFLAVGKASAAARAQIREGLKCSFSPGILKSLLGLVLLAGRVWIRRGARRIARRPARKRHR